VFAEVAQQVLEYLGVPHDVDLKPVANAKPVKPAPEDDSSVDERDIQALYQAANDLPSDDPLRGGPQPQPTSTSTTAPTKTTSPAASQIVSNSPAPPAASAVQQQPQTVTLGDPNRVRVPSLTGIPIRRVIEQAAAAGLEVQIVGNGTCRQQAPAAGAMVAPNTKIVVRCGH
jgi:cell division protein FtsI (penicillin-binding protein 3)